MSMGTKFGGKTAYYASAILSVAGLIIILMRLHLNILRYPCAPYRSDVINITALPSPVSPTNLKLYDRRLHLLPLEIKADHNFMDCRSDFIINRDTVIHVYAVGEGSNYSMNPQLFQAYDNDGIEVFFDMKNEKFPIFDVSKDDRQYRILWKSLSINGENIDTTGVRVIEKDPSSTSYILQVIFPWKTLGYVVPQNNSTIGFDISIIDCDGGTEKGALTWYSKSGDNWENTSLYGTLKLIGAKSHKFETGDTVLVDSIVRMRNNTLDFDPIWNKAPSYPITHVTVGEVTSKADLSGNFKVLWDRANLYLLVSIHDDVKSMAKALFDYGWIEDANGKIVWKMDLDKTNHAGGALKNRMVDTCFRIKSGKYALHYVTDESHSPAQWDDLPPQTQFYGIKLSYSSQKYAGE